MRKARLLLLGTMLASPARAEWNVGPVESSGVEWASGEGLAFRIAPGVIVADDGEPEQTFSLTHGFDVLSHADPYHRWDLIYTRGVNGAYFGTRYQNRHDLAQLEAGVTLGAAFVNWGWGVIYDSREKRLEAVTLRATFPVLVLPWLFFNELGEKDEEKAEPGL